MIIICSSITNGRKLTNLTLLLMLVSTSLGVSGGVPQGREGGAPGRLQLVPLAQVVLPAHGGHRGRLGRPLLADAAGPQKVQK